jgi:hypothetical protein
MVAAAAAALALCLPAAQAHGGDDELELEGSPVCSVTDLSGAAACAGAFEGNNTTRALRPLVLDELADLSDLDGWKLVATLWTERAPTGTLNLLAPIDGAFAIALKAGDNFSLYYFNGVGAAISSFSYTTAGTGLNSRGLPKALSHATLYTTNAVSPVPEPAGYGLLMAGLLGMGVVLRRRLG